jgi:hypothetical protein
METTKIKPESKVTFMDGKVKRGGTVESIATVETAQGTSVSVYLYGIGRRFKPADLTEAGEPEIKTMNETKPKQNGKEKNTATANGKESVAE